MTHNRPLEHALTALAFCVLLVSGSAVYGQQIHGSTAAGEEGLTQHVNPLIGTAPLTDPSFIGYTPEDRRVWAGLVYPGVSLPNAMVQLSPVTEFGTGAGYAYEDDIIQAFAHTNKGHWNYLNIPVLPFSGTLPSDDYGSQFSHESETAEAGFYRVFLEDYGIDVRLTSTKRAGYHRYRYDDGAARKILFDLGTANGSVENWKFEQVGTRGLQGFQQSGGHTIRFYAELDTDIRRIDVQEEGEEDGRAVVRLADGDDPVEMKIGLSFVSVENARKNLSAEIGDETFDEVRTAADQTWESILSTIQVEGGTSEQREMFYTSLYRALLWPAMRSDVNGQYRDVNGQVVTADFNYYTKPSLWDTYRNKLVLLSIISPEVTGDVIRTLQDRGEKTGFIPTFFHGDHAAPFIAGSYARGIDGYDVETVYQLLLNNATKSGGTRPYIEEYMAKGYISTPKIESPEIETKAKAAVSKTLEYAYDDYSVAQLADHDMTGLISLYGGADPFEAKLDSLFTVPWNEEYKAYNVCCFIGQYSHGNQPDHEAPFSYYFVGKPEKSQRIIDTLLTDFYGVGMNGLALPGMDDAGEMTSWYVFGALGLYPFSPADPEYLVTVPLFDRVRWQLDNGKELVFNRPREGRDLQHVEVNGEKIEGYFVPHKVFEQGGQIDIITE